MACRHERASFLLVQAANGQTMHQSLTIEFAQCPFQRVPPVDLDIAVRAENEDP